MILDQQQRLFDLLDNQVDKLRLEINACEGEYHHEPLFDPHLFKAIKTPKGEIPGLQQHLAEIIENIAQLKQIVSKGQTLQVQYLAEKIANQIAAINRELATQKLRVNQPKPPKETPYEVHCRYLEYQRRLIAMQKALEVELSKATTLAARQPLTVKMAALAGRLDRCNQAIVKIEKQLENDMFKE